MISGPFFIGVLVGVGCQMMVLGPRLGTLMGTLSPISMCAFWATPPSPLTGDFSWEAPEWVRGHRFPSSVGFPIERSDVVEHPNPNH
jgi:hypothetical protein